MPRCLPISTSLSHRSLQSASSRVGYHSTALNRHRRSTRSTRFGLSSYPAQRGVPRSPDGLLPFFTPSNPQFHPILSSHGPRWFSTSQSSSRPSDSKVLTPFLLADIGEGITGCEIVKWLVKPGQSVAEFDPIAEVQSDKATVEITSPYDGTIDTLVGQTGQVVKVGEPLCLILVDDHSLSSHDAEIPQQKSGSIHPNQLESHRPTDQAIPPIRHLSPPASDQLPRTDVHSTPSVRRLAREHRLDMSTIKGTGKAGRVTKEDVLNLLAALDSSQPPQPTAIEHSKSNLDRSTINGPLGAVRQAMFRGMTQSLRIPHFGYSDQIDVTDLERIRLDLVQRHPESRITILCLFIKILGRSMIENGLFRCTLTNDDPPRLVPRQSCDVSIAVDSPAGLLTPLIPSVDSKSIIQIASHLTRLRQFIHQSPPDRIPRIPDELGGNRSGTFTLSNIGTIGGTYTHPVIPPTGQLAIGAIGSIRARPEYSIDDRDLARSWAIHGRPQQANRELKIEPRLMVEVSFTADHRAVEGVELAKLVKSFKSYCQSPNLLLAELV